MPQLVKRGKWIFGWVIVDEMNRIRIPRDAFLEYGFTSGEQVTITRGSRSSGGFGIARDVLFRESILQGSRTLMPARMGENDCFTIPAELNFNPGKRFLVGRGSFLALSFLEYGRIVEEAVKHPEIETFIP